MLQGIPDGQQNENPERHIDTDDHLFVLRLSRLPHPSSRPHTGEQRYADDEGDPRED
jgi:hypothetical protein